MNNLPKEGSHELSSKWEAEARARAEENAALADPARSVDGAAIRPVAVIDIGATSIRMTVAEITKDGNVRTLDALVQAVDLGREAFANRRISRATIERSASILRRYKRVLREYGITSSSHIRVVATSAVREAVNRLAFTDRVFIATGLVVEIIDEAEVNRITYMGIHHNLENDEELQKAQSVVVEVGGGSTELLVMRDGDMLLSDTFRLGALRMVEMIQSANTTQWRRRSLMEHQIGRIVDRISDIVPGAADTRLIAIGGDIRFAAREILEYWEPGTFARLPTAKLAELTNQVLRLDEDGIVRRYGVSFIEAETLGPALLTYLKIAEHFQAQEVLVSDTNLRDGLLHDIALGGNWTSAFRNLIVRSAIALGRKCGFDEEHALQTAWLASELFSQLTREHRLTERFEVILHVAAILYQIGLFINLRSSHKHSMYLIRNSELFGLSKNDLLLVGLVARYHRRSSPQPTHEGYGSLPREERVVVAKLAAILRVAIALDESRTGRVRQFRCIRESKRLVIELPGNEDNSMEQLALRQNGSLFEEVYGIPVMLRSRV